ncbi:MAG TPA: hypothetical protein VK508_00010 [Cyclobacteriaceae bacterium]|nr:hypothetical protein [Cyclobacteriaceae bacterium]
MIKRYLVASFLGGLIGAGCVLVIVYVTNTRALVIVGGEIDPAVNALHSRINDFYIFAGIVITLLLAINVGVFVRADEEVDKQIEESFGKHEKEIIKLIGHYRELYFNLEKTEKNQINKPTDYDPAEPEAHS